MTTIEKIIEELFQKKADRINSEIPFVYKNIFKTYIGIEEPEIFDLMLYEINSKLKNKSNVLFLEDSLKISTDFELIESIKNDYEKVKESNFKYSNLKLVNNVVLNSIVLENLDKLLNLIDKEIHHTKMNFATKFMLWIKEYLKDIDFNNNELCKCIYYGDIKKHESYFLMFLNMCGFDVVYINPCGNGVIKNILNYCNNFDIYEFNTVVEKMSFDDRVKSGGILKQGSINKATTVTALAQKQIQSELYNDTGMIIDSWQLQDLELQTITLNTTFDELLIYYNQALNFRPYYKSEDGIIEAPVFFSKIVGVHENEWEYYDFLTKIKDNENSLFLKYDGSDSVLRDKEFTKSDFKLMYSIESEDKINRDTTVNKKEFSISVFDTELQNKILDSVEQVFKSKCFLEALEDSDKVQILHFALNLNKKVLFLLENFAYGRINPKLVLFMEERVSMSKEFCAILLILNRLGLDILLVTPVGSKDIEKIVDTDVINIHRLSRIIESFDLNSSTLKKPGFLNKILNKFMK